MSEPAVSVVIPHYGAAELTLSLCEQLMQQHVDGGMEVIVADDCSPVPFPGYPGVRSVRREANGGFGSACNTGARLASGKYLLVLNSDIDLPEGVITRLLETAEPFQPGVFGPAVRSHGQLQLTARRFPTARYLATERLEVLHRLRHRPIGQRAVGLDPVPAGTDVYPCDWLMGAALLIPRAAFEAVGGFDEGYFMYAEEVDLQRRLSERGITSYLLPGVEVGHLGGASTDPSRARQWLVDSRVRYAAKWGGHRRLVAGIVVVSGINVVTSSVRRLLGRPTTPLTTLRTDLGQLRHAVTHLAAPPSATQGEPAT